MKTVLIIVACVVTLFGAFVVWRLIATVRGSVARDEMLLARIDPIVERLEGGAVITPETIASLAAAPENRFMLFAALRSQKRDDLLPTAYASSVAQGESALVYWLLHPNEFEQAPAAIEFVETFQRRVDGRDADFHVYRFRMAEGHWAAADGWILGLAGPMAAAGDPYAEMPSAFSRGAEPEGNVTPAALVDWYVDMLREKGMVR